MSMFSKSKDRALKKEASKAIFWVMLMLLVVTTVIGLSFYIYSYLRGYKHEMDTIASYALAQYEEGYLEQEFKETREAYESIPEEIRKDAFTEEFKSYIRPYVDDTFKAAREQLMKCRENTPISNIYMGFYDEEYERLAGSVDMEEIKKIAMTDLKMKYPVEDQVVHITVEEDDYVRQYEKIPEKND